MCTSAQDPIRQSLCPDAPGALTPGPLMPSWESFASPFPATVTVSNMFLWDDFSSLVITMAGSDPTTGFFPYLDGNGFPDVTFEFGVQILSLDFTPVPEPAAASLVVIGLLLFGMRHRLGRKN